VLAAVAAGPSVSVPSTNRDRRAGLPAPGATRATHPAGRSPPARPVDHEVPKRSDRDEAADEHDHKKDPKDCRFSGRENVGTHRVAHGPRCECCDRSATANASGSQAIRSSEGTEPADRPDHHRLPGRRCWLRRCAHTWPAVPPRVHRRHERPSDGVAARERSMQAGKGLTNLVVRTHEPPCDGQRFSSPLERSSRCVVRDRGSSGTRGHECLNRG
jgi:hypothetical protein